MYLVNFVLLFIFDESTSRNKIGQDNYNTLTNWRLFSDTFSFQNFDDPLHLFLSTQQLTYSTFDDFFEIIQIEANFALSSSLISDVSLYLPTESMIIKVKVTDIFPCSSLWLLFN